MTSLNTTFASTTPLSLGPSLEGPARDPSPSDRCWSRIGVEGDRSCPELKTFIHCRNCPVFEAAARTFFERGAPAGYLDEWGRWLNSSECGEFLGQEREAHGLLHECAIAEREETSVLIFRMGTELLAFRVSAIAEVVAPRAVHHVPHRSNQVFFGLVNLQGRAELCVCLFGLLGVEGCSSATLAAAMVPGATFATSRARLVVMRDPRRAESWAFAVDEILGVHGVDAEDWHEPPSTLANPEVGFSEAVLDWDGRNVGLLDEQRVFAALRELGA